MRYTDFRMALTGALAVSLGLWTTATLATPKVVVISLDGAKPDVIEEQLEAGAFDKRTGIGRLKKHGIVARQNITATPSVTAVSHIAIATGSTAVHNDIPGNSFHPVAAPIGTNISGFAAPIGGYQLNPLDESPAPTAVPLWVQLRDAGREVVTATWPGSDGADIRITGILVQKAEPTRTNDYTVPFGAFGGLGAVGFTRTAADFADASPTLVAELAAVGRPSFSPIKETTSPIETVFCAPMESSSCGTTNASGRTLRYDLKVAALDSTDDGHTNYETLVFFDANAGVAPGPFVRPSTGPAYVRVGGPSDDFFFEGSGNRVGTAFFVSHLASDVSSVRFARYAANFIPRNAPVLAVVDDVNGNVGFWAPQPDFRIPERLSPGFSGFPDLELEAIYEDQVRTFTNYQTRLGVHAIEQNPNADLVMLYFEQPDGSGHQFTLTDRRQATNPLDPTTIGRPGDPPGATGQDTAKIARYRGYVNFAYQAVNDAVETIVQAVGVDKHGAPLRDVFVVSDHGMAPFHSAVNLGALLANAGIDTSKLNLRTTGPATHIYVNLQGRESGGTVTIAEYETSIQQIAGALRSASDPNPNYNPRRIRLFTHVWMRPLSCGQPGFCTDENIGQDSGDVFALMAEGYNFDGTQSPVVARLGDTAATTTPVYSVPNFYGAHGHDSSLRSMSAILYAAGPSLKQGKEVRKVRNIDIAPTVMKILRVEPADTVDGEIIQKIFEFHHDD